MFDSFCLISAEEVETDGHPLAWSEGPRPVFEERDVSEPEREKERWEVGEGGGGDGLPQSSKVSP